MKKIIIIGSGGHGKVILDIFLKRKEILKEKIEIIGFLDDYSKKTIYGYDVIGNLNDINKLNNEIENIYFIIAFGNNNFRKEVFEKNKKIKYISAIHPTVSIGIECEIKDGTVIKANSVISPNTKIGKHCIINSLVSIEQDSIIEDFVHIFPNVSLYGENRVTSGVTVFSNVSTEHGVKISNDVKFGSHIKREN